MFVTKSAQTAATVYLCYGGYRSLQASVKKRRATLPEENFLLLKPNLTSFTVFTSITRYAAAREIVGIIYTRRTISTGVVSAVIDIYQNNGK